MSTINGGYDEGYKSVSCFWGRTPGSLVAEYLARHPEGHGVRALDLGCGEGKNAAALTRAGYLVDAIDCCSAALRNGMIAFSCLDIRWREADAMRLPLQPAEYVVVVAYGLFHCLPNLREISSLIDRTKEATRPGGYHIVCAFNNRSQDLRAHEGFSPTLASHEWYLQKYRDWDTITATDSILHEVHPHNRIPHHHSLTRILVMRPE